MMQKTKEFMTPAIVACVLLAGLRAVPGQAPDANWDRLPLEAREILTDTLLPRIATSDLVDLDGDGDEEIVLMSQSPLVLSSEAEDLGDLQFQSLLMIFERTGESDQSFPYRVRVIKSLTSSLPKPAHLSYQNMGGDANPELIWLQGGPDSEGRYSEVILYSYRPDEPNPMVEVARLKPEEGWLRIYDLDSDGVSEVVSFSKKQGQTYCRDLLFATPTGWTTLVSEIRKLGVPDVLSFQQQHGLEPNGKISRKVYEKLKEVLKIPQTPSSSIPLATGDPSIAEWEFVDEE